MNITTMISALRTELGDIDELNPLWTETELTRAIIKAVTDVDRFFPAERCYEVTLQFSVVNETWTTGASPGTWVSLANKPISYNSEVVKSADGTITYTRDTDYIIDYINGKITHVSGGSMSDNTEYLISYEKSRVAIDISSLNIIRVHRVEYPYGKVPQSFSSFEVFDNKLWLVGIEAESQSKLSEGKHAVIYYFTQNTPPTATESGSFPRHLDEVVVKGASAYACFLKALQYEYKAIDDLNSARAKLANINHSKVAAALDVISSKLGQVDTYLTGASDPSSRKYLTDGDNYINQVTVGADVSERYATYAQRANDIAVAIIREAAEYNNEAISRLSEIDRYLAESAQYVSLATQNINFAERLRTEGQRRLDEFLRILINRAELRGGTVTSVSAKQIRS